MIDPATLLSAAKIDMVDSDSYRPKELVRAVQLTEPTQFDGGDVGMPGDWLVELTDGTRKLYSPDDFEIAFEQAIKITQVTEAP